MENTLKIARLVETNVFFRLKQATGFRWFLINIKQAAASYCVDPAASQFIIILSLKSKYIEKEKTSIILDYQGFLWGD